MESKLEVWKLAHELTLAVDNVSRKFPSSEMYGLTSQLKRSSVSVETNIIDGQGRPYQKEFIQLLYISEDALHETNDQLFLAKKLKYITDEEYIVLFEMCTRIKMMIYKLIKSLKK